MQFSSSIGFTVVKNTVCPPRLRICPPKINPLLIVERSSSSMVSVLSVTCISTPFTIRTQEAVPS